MSHDDDRWAPAAAQGPSADAPTAGQPAGGAAGRPAPIEVSAEPFAVDAGARGEVAAGVNRSPARTRRVVVGALLAVGLAGAAALGTAAWRINQQQDTTLQTPGQIDALRRDDSERAASTAEYLRSALSAEVGLRETVGAVYADPADAARSVLLFGGTALLWRPERELDKAIQLVGDDTGAVTDVGEVPAGELGGVMKCGTTTSTDGAIAVCGWADHGSLAVALFPGRTPADSASTMRKIRTAVQQRD